jgi:DNA repair protein RadC
MPKVVTSKDAFHCFKHVWSDKIEFVEESILLLLNRANKALGFVKLSSGGTTGTIVDIKLIFAIALKTNAHSIIIAHNHPSGNLRPSDADLKLTKELSASGKILGIPLLDHLILTDEGYYSMSDEGVLT